MTVAVTDGLGLHVLADRTQTDLLHNAAAMLLLSCCHGGVYVCVCVRTCTHLCTCIHMGACDCKTMQLGLHSNLHCALVGWSIGNVARVVCVCVRCAYMGGCTTAVCVCMCVCVRVCVHVCVYMRERERERERKRERRSIYI